MRGDHTITADGTTSRMEMSKGMEQLSRMTGEAIRLAASQGEPSTSRTETNPAVRFLTFVV